MRCEVYPFGSRPRRFAPLLRGCAGHAASPLDRCLAGGDGSRCQLCTRVGDLAEQVAWPGPCWQFPGPSVQAIRRGRQWQVAVFTDAPNLDVRFPVIGCTKSRRAISLAHDRARQLSPDGRLIVIERGRQWRRGIVNIATWDPGR